MPKVAIDEDCETGGRKDDVGPSREALDVSTEAKSLAPQRAMDKPFQSCVTAANT